MKIWVIIPAYNEALRLDRLLEQLKEKNLPVLVIDDGSKDATYEVAKKKATLAVSHSKNFGKGLSLNRGISYLLSNEQFDYVIIMDADGQHAPADLGLFLKEAEAGADFVVGNRMREPSGMPFLRIVTNKLMSGLISKIAGQRIPDSQCGFRMIKREVLEKIDLKTKKFEIESEILIKAARLGFRIKSIPVKSIYFANPQSKIRPFRDTLRFIKFLSKIDK